MKTLTKAAIGLSAAGAAFIGVQKIRHRVADERENRVEIHGFVSHGFESVRDAFAENFARRREVGTACCVYHKGEKVVDLWPMTRSAYTRAISKFLPAVGWGRRDPSHVHTAFSQLEEGSLEYVPRLWRNWPRRRLLRRTVSMTSV